MERNTDVAAVILAESETGRLCVGQRRYPPRRSSVWARSRSTAGRLKMALSASSASPSAGLTQWVGLIEQEKLASVVEVHAPLIKIARVTVDLIQRRFVGDAIPIINSAPA
jgi:hypothetical protein